MNSTRARQWLTLLTYSTMAASCGSADDSDDTAATLPDGSETTTGSSGEDGSSTSSGDTGTTGTELTPDEICAAVGDLAYDCYDGGYGYTAQQYAQNCVDDLAAYADDPACYDQLLQAYSCDALLPCEEFGMSPPCDALDAAFEKDCV